MYILQISQKNTPLVSYQLTFPLVYKLFFFFHTSYTGDNPQDPGLPSLSGRLCQYSNQLKLPAAVQERAGQILKDIQDADLFSRDVKVCRFIVNAFYLFTIHDYVR